jgi:hypothetical protein
VLALNSNWSIFRTISGTHDTMIPDSQGVMYLGIYFCNLAIFFIISEIETLEADNRSDTNRAMAPGLSTSLIGMSMS